MILQSNILYSKLEQIIFAMLFSLRIFVVTTEENPLEGSPEFDRHGCVKNWVDGAAILHSIDIDR